MRSGAFPGPEHGFHMAEEESEGFERLIADGD
jgi:hypothetical protein